MTSTSAAATKDRGAMPLHKHHQHHHKQQHHRRSQRWPAAHELPQVQTLAGRFWRRSVLGGIYFFWVCGLAGAVTMWLRTLYAVARAMMTRNAEPVPTNVAAFVACMVAYESYRVLAPLTPWLRLRHFVRHKFSRYPYFRFNTCVFEHELLTHNTAAEHANVETSDSSGADQQCSQQQECESEPEPSAGETNDFDLSYNFTPALAPNDRALYAFHPHGILTCGMALNGAHHLRFAETGARWLVAENLFWFPVLRDLLKWLEFDNVSKRTFEALMKSGQNIGFVPGGFEEATLYARGKHRVFLKKRFGFIKLALQHGYKVYPAYTFGEEETYHAFPFLLPLRLKLNEFKIPGALFAGSPWCFFMPRSDVDLITVVGTPLQLPTIKNPSAQDVQKYHALYVQKLRDLFDKHKAAYATDPNAELEIY